MNDIVINANVAKCSTHYISREYSCTLESNRMTDNVYRSLLTTIDMTVSKLSDFTDSTDLSVLGT